MSEGFSLKRKITVKNLTEPRTHHGADDYTINEDRGFIGRQATKKIYDAGIGKAFGEAKGDEQDEDLPQSHSHNHHGANKTEYQKLVEKEMLIFKKSLIAQLMPLHYKPYQGCPVDRICAYTTMLERSYSTILSTKLVSETFNFKMSILDQKVRIMLL